MIRSSRPPTTVKTDNVTTLHSKLPHQASSKSQRPRSNIPAPGSLKFGLKKEEKVVAPNEQGAKVTVEEDSSSNVVVGQSSSIVVDDRESKRQSTVAALVGYGTQRSCSPPTLPAAAAIDIINSPSSGGDSLNQTFTQSKFLYRLIETEYSRAIGKRVCLAGEKYGTLRYFGPLHVAEGLFCGIELEEELGSHDGYIDGRRYFKALHRHGIFAPVEKVKIVDVTVPSSTSLKGDADSDVITAMNVDDARSSELTRFDQTFTTVGCENFIIPTIGRGEMVDDADAELLDDIEPHLMSYSMLDDENTVENNATVQPTNPLLQSFELSDSLMFLKQSNLPGVEASMNASQLAAMMMSDDGDRKRKSVEYLVDEEEPNVEQMYFDEATTPMCDINFLTEIEQSFSKKDLFSSTPCNDIASLVQNDDKQRVVCGQDIYPCEQDGSKLPSSSVDERTIRDENNALAGDDITKNTTVNLRRTNSLNKSKDGGGRSVERPISTVSADTGYQGDTEYETQSGRSVSPPEPDELDVCYEKVCDKTVVLQKASAKDNVLMESQQNGVVEETSAVNSSMESLVCETVYRDKAGNVVKIVRGEVPASLPIKKLPSSATIENMKDFMDEQQQKNVVVNGEKSATKREATKKVSPEGSPSKNKRSKGESAVGLDSSTRKPVVSAKKEAEKKPEKEFVRQKVVREVEPPPKIVRAPPKPSKHAEIMAKLQQSIAQEKSKPKKEVKSRVYVPGDGSKLDDTSQLYPSRSQSRASSVLTSAQVSPADGGNSILGEGGETKIQNVEHALTNGEAATGHVSLKKTGVKTTEQHAKNVVGKDTVIKRDSIHDVSKNGLPPSGVNANKRLPVTKASSLSNSGRFNKSALSGQVHQGNLNKTAPLALKQENSTDKKDELLKIAKENLIHSAKGFQAMCVTIKHYDEQLIPALYLQISEFKKELADAKDGSETLSREKSELLTEKETLKANIDNTKKEHEELLKKAENKLRKELEKQLFEASNAHEEEIKKVVDEFRLKEKRLMKGYEKRQNDDALQYQHKVAQLKEQHTKDLNELKSAHAKEIEDLKCQFDSKKTILQIKLADSQALCERYKNESRELEATLMTDIDKKMQHVNERFAVYQQEIDSLRVVVEMKNTEIHELRNKCFTLEKDLETLPATKTKVAVLEQKNAELREALESRKFAERRLSQKHLELQQTCERERERLVRLSMTNEQLQYRLQHLMMSHSAYETPMSRFVSDESDADSVIRDKPMSQSLIQIYAGSSPRTSKHVPVTVYTNEGISRALLFDKSDSESSSSQHRKRTSSERKASLSDDSSSPSPQTTTTRAKSAEKSTPPSSTSSASSGGQRRISPLRRRNISGASLVVGAPGVETVSEVSEGGFCDVPTAEIATKSDTDDTGDGSRKVCKSSSQGQGCWTDSGIFTSSFHSETADQPLQGTTTVTDHSSNLLAAFPDGTFVAERKSSKDDAEETTPTKK